MGKEMTFFLFIGIFQGIVSETKAFRKEEDAKQAFYDFTNLDWDKVTSNNENCRVLDYSDFGGSQISELQIEA